VAGKLHGNPNLGPASQKHYVIRHSLY